MSLDYRDLSSSDVTLLSNIPYPSYVYITKKAFDNAMTKVGVMANNTVNHIIRDVHKYIRQIIHVVVKKEQKDVQTLHKYNPNINSIEDILVMLNKNTIDEAIEHQQFLQALSTYNIVEKSLSAHNRTTDTKFHISKKDKNLLIINKYLQKYKKELEDYSGSLKPLLKHDFASYILPKMAGPMFEFAHSKLSSFIDNKINHNVLKATNRVEAGEKIGRNTIDWKGDHSTTIFDNTDTKQPIPLCTIMFQDKMSSNIYYDIKTNTYKFQPTYTDPFDRTFPFDFPTYNLPLKSHDTHRLQSLLLLMVVNTKAFRSYTVNNQIINSIERGYVFPALVHSIVGSTLISTNGYKHLDPMSIPTVIPNAKGYGLTRNLLASLLQTNVQDLHLFWNSSHFKRLFAANGQYYHTMHKNYLPLIDKVLKHDKITSEIDLLNNAQINAFLKEEQLKLSKECKIEQRMRVTYNNVINLL